VDEAEQDPWRCRRENTTGPSVLAKACAPYHISFLTFSSDLVFGGSRSLPYRESDTVAPLNVYGHSKVEAERYVLRILPSALIVRTSAFFGPWDRHNFVTSALETLIEGKPFQAAVDTVISPTYVPDLVHASLDLLLDQEHGVWHLANQGATSWADLARLVAKLAQLDPALVEDCDGAFLGYVAPRPAYSALTSERGLLLPSLQDSVSRYLQERDVALCALT
jgi:dTDP-4-dehydrorhamnose reductase